MTPKEKIPEAYTAVIDNRVTINDNSASVKSSDLKKEYTIKWKDNRLYSFDSFRGTMLKRVTLLIKELGIIPNSILFINKEEGGNY